MFTHSKTGIENVIKFLENVMEDFKKNFRVEKTFLKMK